MTCLRIDGIHTQKNYCRLILECMWVSFFFNMNLVLDIIKKNDDDDDVFLFLLLLLFIFFGIIIVLLLFRPWVKIPLLNHPAFWTFRIQPPWIKITCCNNRITALIDIKCNGGRYLVLNSRGIFFFFFLSSMIIIIIKQIIIKLLNETHKSRTIFFF